LRPPQVSPSSSCNEGCQGNAPLPLPQLNTI
jgi:hypothetical protein